MAAQEHNQPLTPSFGSFDNRPVTPMNPPNTPSRPFQTAITNANSDQVLMARHRSRSEAQMIQSLQTHRKVAFAMSQTSSTESQGSVSSLYSSTQGQTTGVPSDFAERDLTSTAYKQAHDGAATTPSHVHAHPQLVATSRWASSIGPIDTPTRFRAASLSTTQVSRDDHRLLTHGAATPFGCAGLSQFRSPGMPDWLVKPSRHDAPVMQHFSPVNDGRRSVTDSSGDSPHTHSLSESERWAVSTSSPISSDAADSFSGSLDLPSRIIGYDWKPESHATPSRRTSGGFATHPGTRNISMVSTSASQPRSTIRRMQTFSTATPPRPDPLCYNCLSDKDHDHPLSPQYGSQGVTYNSISPSSGSPVRKRAFTSAADAVKSSMPSGMVSSDVENLSAVAPPERYQSSLSAHARPFEITKSNSMALDEADPRAVAAVLQYHRTSPSRRTLDDFNKLPCELCGSLVLRWATLLPCGHRACSACCCSGVNQVSTTPPRKHVCAACHVPVTGLTLSLPAAQAAQAAAAGGGQVAGPYEAYCTPSEDFNDMYDGIEHLQTSRDFAGCFPGVTESLLGIDKPVRGPDTSSVVANAVTASRQRSPSGTRSVIMGPSSDNAPPADSSMLFSEDASFFYRPQHMGQAQSPDAPCLIRYASPATSPQRYVASGSQVLGAELPQESHASSGFSTNQRGWIPAVVRIDNIPWTTCYTDIVKWLPDAESLLPDPAGTPQPVHVPIDVKTGKTANCAFIELRDDEAAKKLIRKRNNTKLCNRPVSLLLSSYGDLVAELFPSIHQFDPSTPTRMLTYVTSWQLEQLAQLIKQGGPQLKSPLKPIEFTTSMVQLVPSDLSPDQRDMLAERALHVLRRATSWLEDGIDGLSLAIHRLAQAGLNCRAFTRMQKVRIFEHMQNVPDSKAAATEDAQIDQIIALTEASPSRAPSSQHNSDRSFDEDNVGLGSIGDQAPSRYMHQPVPLHFEMSQGMIGVGPTSRLHHPQGYPHLGSDEVQQLTPRPYQVTFADAVSKHPFAGHPERPSSIDRALEPPYDAQEGFRPVISHPEPMTMDQLIPSGLLNGHFAPVVPAAMDARDWTPPPSRSGLVKSPGRAGVIQPHLSSSALHDKMRDF